MVYRPADVFERRMHEANSSPFRKSSTAWAVSACIASLALSACGGGGSESVAGASGLTLSGQAVKGPVSGGLVCAYTLQTPRQQIACATTDSKANYQLQLPAGTGEVLLEVTGGSYVDEATGKTVNLTTPLRTVTKAAAVLENVLLTPFTELAVQRAAAAHPAGQLSLVSFRSKINELETGLGLSGLADGKPFGGSSTQDANHQRALAAFAKLQAGNGKDVAGALQIMGSQLDQCGVNSLGITLAAYSAASTVGLSTTGSGSGSSTTGSGSGGGTVSIGSGGGLKLASVASSTPSADVYIHGALINIALPPAVCTDSFSIDGASQPVTDLFQTLTPSSWATAQQVSATICGATAGLNMNFPQATINLLADLQTSGNVNIQQGSLNPGGGGIVGPLPTPIGIGVATLGPGMSPISLASSGLVLNKGCYQSSNGASFANANVVALTLSSFNGGVSLNNAGTVGNLAGSAMISSGSNSTLSSPTTPILISTGSLVSGVGSSVGVTNSTAPVNLGALIVTSSSGGLPNSPTNSPVNLTSP